MNCTQPETKGIAQTHALPREKKGIAEMQFSYARERDMDAAENAAPLIHLTPVLFAKVPIS